MRFVFLLPLGVALAVASLSSPAVRAQQSPPGAVEVEVTGHPAPGWLVARAVERAIRWTTPEQELTVALASPPGDLGSGAEIVVTARVSARGSTTPAASVVAVRVRNRPSLCQTARLLFVSNSPETLRFATGLFRGSLASGETVRMVYHHRNGTEGQPMALRVQVANPSRAPARLWVNDASSAPVRDELLAGHVATARWLPQYWNCAAQSVEVPPNGTLTLDALTLAPGQVGSGLLQVWLARGERVVLDVQARVGVLDPAQESYLINKDTTHVRGTFESPVRELQVAHNAGETSLLTIGGPDRAEAAAGRSLGGNYGVIYNIRGILKNPSSEPRKVVLRAMATGGAARGTFLVNGRVSETGLLRPGAPATLSVIPLPAGGRVPFFLSTLLQSGSAYPVRILLGPP